LSLYFASFYDRYALLDAKDDGVAFEGLLVWTAIQSALAYLAYQHK
jgi:hypothetical protein